MDQKTQKFRVPDLKAKVMTLEAVFGEKFMRSGLNTRTIDKWLKQPDPTPYLTSLKIYFGVIGMKESDMIKPKHEFSEKVAEIFSRLRGAEDVTYSPGDVAAIYESFEESTPGEPGLLGTTLKMIPWETLRNDYLYLKGDYHMYHYWKSDHEHEAGKIRRNLVSVHDLDERRGLMKSRITIARKRHQSREDWWEYEGWVFNIKNKLFWLFECVKGMPPEIVTFHIFKPPFWPDPEDFFLHGIVSALALDGLPSASTMLLKKIKADDPLRHKLGYFTPEEIKTEGHGIDIAAYIHNKIKDPREILSARPPR